MTMKIAAYQRMACFARPSVMKSIQCLLNAGHLQLYLRELVAPR